MIKSMTGFASVTREDERATIAVTIRTLNHRHLDLQLRMPQILAGLEGEVRTRVSKRVARGRVAIAIHLLAPNGRPMQVTTDLESFWRRTYPEVRRELRARYPRHDWPLDPSTAAPTARPKRVRSRK